MRTQMEAYPQRVKQHSLQKGTGTQPQVIMASALKAALRVARASAQFLGLCQCRHTPRPTANFHGDKEGQLGVVDFNVVQRQEILFA